MQMATHLFLNCPKLTYPGQSFMHNIYPDILGTLTKNKDTNTYIPYLKWFFGHFYALSMFRELLN